MKFPLRLLFASALAATAALYPQAGQAGHFKTYNNSDYEQRLNPSWQEEDRTVNRTPEGIIQYPQWLMDHPEHYEFLPNVSNWDAQNKHPQQWKGQDWDPSKWDGKQWTPGIAVQKFYQGRIFERQYMRGRMPVVVLGPVFYKLSDLDQRRTLKLLTDYTGIFGKGYQVVELRDWNTKEVIGSYTPKGMYLN